MAVAVESVSTAFTGSGNSLSYSLPSGTADGDLLLLFHALDPVSTPTPPSGFSTLYTHTGTSTRVAVYYKIASSETGPYTVSMSVFARASGGLLRISGADTTSPFDVFDGGEITGFPTSGAAPSISTTQSGCLLLAYCSTQYDPDTISTPAGMAEVFQNTTGNNGYNGGTSKVASEILASAGATGTRTFTWTHAANADVASIAVAPAAGGGGTDVSVALTGNSGTGSVGSVTVTSAQNISTALTGNAGTGNLGTLTADGKNIFPVTGQSATGSAGSLSVAGAANVSLTGDAATGSAGDVTVSTTSLVQVDLAGFKAAGSTGSLTASGGAIVPLTGNAGTSAAGSVAVTGGSVVPLTGNAAAGAVGSLSVEAGGSITVPLAGKQATGSVGDLTVSTTGGVSVALTGLSAVGTVGVLSVPVPSKASGDDAGPRWAPRHVRPIRVIYDEEDVREVLGSEAKSAPNPTKARKRRLSRDVEQKVLSGSPIPSIFAPVVERAISQEIGMAWKGPSDWEVLSAILNVAAQKAIEEIQRIQAEIEEEDEMILLFAA